MINYQLRCSDLGFDTCNFIITGNSESEIKRKLFFHTILNHEKEYEELPEEKKNELHTSIAKILEEQS